jgi:gliding motility-associated-like protein
VYRVCQGNVCNSATISISVTTVDSDGDGVSDAQEGVDGTNPTNSCSFKLTSQTEPTTAAWKVADCDGDGLTNQEEITGKDDLSTAADPNGITTDPLNIDTDGDGVDDGQEALDGTDPINSCDAIPANISQAVSAAFLTGDCDGDGLTNENELGDDLLNPMDSDDDGLPDYIEFNNHQDNEDNLEIYNSMTNNGDELNDVFVIRGIEKYPDNTLSIYNRWGVEIYSAEGYAQDNKFFRGLSEGRKTISASAELPKGTYYYILRYVNKQGIEKQRSGYLYITK